MAPMVIKDIETEEILELKEIRPLSLWPIYEDEEENEISLTPFPEIQGYEVLQ